MVGQSRVDRGRDEFGSAEFDAAQQRSQQRAAKLAFSESEIKRILPSILSPDCNASYIDELSNVTQRYELSNALADYLHLSRVIDGAPADFELLNARIRIGDAAVRLDPANCWKRSILLADIERKLKIIRPIDSPIQNNQAEAEDRLVRFGVRVVRGVLHYDPSTQNKILEGIIAIPQTKNLAATVEALSYATALELRTAQLHAVEGRHAEASHAAKIGLRFGATMRSYLGLPRDLTQLIEEAADQFKGSLRFSLRKSLRSEAMLLEFVR